MTAQGRTATALIGLGALALGLVAGAALFAGPRGTEPPAGAGEELVEELARLRQAQARTAGVLERLEELFAEPELAPAATPGERVAIGDFPPPESFDALARSLDALRATLERESNETQSLIRSAPALGGETLIDVRDRRADVDWVALEALAERWHGDAHAADRSQYFQTSRDLLEAYGPPSAIYRPKDGLLFKYRDAPEDVPAPSWYFRLKDGIVIEFWLETEPEPGEDS